MHDRFFYPFSLEGGPRRQKVGMRVKAGNSVFKRLTPPPSPWPSPTRGEGITLCSPAWTAFAPSPLTGEGGDEGGADHAVFKRLRRPPHPNPLPQGEREVLCQPISNRFCPFSLDGRRLG